MTRVKNCQALRQQMAVPGMGCAALPRSAADGAEVLGGGVEDGRLRSRGVAELAAADRAHAVVLPQKDAIRIEDRGAELALECAQRAEHPVDRTSGTLALLVGGDDEEAPLAQIACGADRRAVRGPLIEEG